MTVIRPIGRIIDGQVEYYDAGGEELDDTASDVLGDGEILRVPVHLMDHGVGDEVHDEDGGDVSDGGGDDVGDGDDVRTSGDGYMPSVWQSLKESFDVHRSMAVRE